MSQLHERTTKSMLAEGFRGALIEAGDEGYDASRAVWNGLVNRKPALIAQCADADDVIAALDYAKSNDLAISVRAGGHNVTGAAVVDGGVVIDLSQMKGLEIDLERRVARAEPGLTWGEYSAAVGEHGFATPSGKISSTGVGGLALGGGIGWLVRKYGLTIDNLLSAQIVTADGQLLTASSMENPDLFWAIRGGGGNFGIAVSFEFRLHYVPQVYGGLIAYPASMAEDVLKFYRSYIADAPDEITCVAALFTGPDGNKAVGVAVCYAGPVDEGELTVKPLLDFAPPVMTQLGAMPYHVLGGMLDPMAAPGVSRAWRSSVISDFSDDAIATIVDIFQDAPTHHCVVLIEQFGGAMGRIDPSATAFPLRNAKLNLVIDAGWDERPEGYAALGWLHHLWNGVQPYVTGSTYVGFLDNEGQERVKSAYGEANYARLAEIKAVYDPTNLFRGNQNIAPKSPAR